MVLGLRTPGVGRESALKPQAEDSASRPNECSQLIS